MIKSLELRHFMMEDYLLKVLLSNPDDFFQSMKFKIINSSKLEERISEILSLLRQQDISVTSSKEVLTLMRALLRDMPPYPLIEDIIQKTNDTSLKDHVVWDD